MSIRVVPAYAPDARILNAANLAADLKQILGGKAYTLSQAETTPEVHIRPIGDDWRSVLAPRVGGAAEYSGGADMAADTLYDMTHDFDEAEVPAMAKAARLLCTHCHQISVAQAERVEDGVATLSTVLYGVTADNQLLGIAFDRYGEYC